MKQRCCQKKTPRSREIVVVVSMAPPLFNRSMALLASQLERLENNFVTFVPRMPSLENRVSDMQKHIDRLEHRMDAQLKNDIEIDMRDVLGYLEPVRAGQLPPPSTAFSLRCCLFVLSLHKMYIR